MSELKLFLKENKTEKENVFYRATSSLKDENGESVAWEIRHITTDEDEQIRSECVKADKKGSRFDAGMYMKKMAVKSVVYPPLYNAVLQDSYGVRTPEELLCSLIDNPGEYQEFIRFIQKINGFDVNMEKRVEQAKN